MPDKTIYQVGCSVVLVEFQNDILCLRVREYPDYANLRRIFAGCCYFLLNELF